MGMATVMGMGMGMGMGLGLGLGDGDGDGDAECPNPNEMMCDGQCIDVLDNDDNCGTCGHTCPGSGDGGGCLNGACLPFWGECFAPDDFVDCDGACAAEGKTCAENGCDGATNVLYLALDACEALGSGDENSLGCGSDFSQVGPAMRCCCNQD
jgi:hypothetical protein